MPCSPAEEPRSKRWSTKLGVNPELTGNFLKRSEFRGTGKQGKRVLISGTKAIQRPVQSDCAEFADWG